MKRNDAIMVLAMLYVAGVGTGWMWRGESVQKQNVKILIGQAKEVENVETRKADREIVYRDRIKVIHEATADCLDQPVPADLLHVLRAGPAKSGVDAGLRVSTATGTDVP